MAFDRGGAITLATRLPAGLAMRGGWGDTTLTLPTSGQYVDVFTGASYSGELSVAAALDQYPAALLILANPDE